MSSLPAIVRPAANSGAWLVVRSMLDDADPTRRRVARAHWYPAGILPTSACGWTPLEARAVGLGETWTDLIAESVRWTDSVNGDRCSRCARLAGAEAD